MYFIFLDGKKLLSYTIGIIPLDVKTSGCAKICVLCQYDVGEFPNFLASFDCHSGFPLTFSHFCFRVHIFLFIRNMILEWSLTVS